MKPIVMTFKDAPKERLLNSEVLASTFNGTVYVGGTDTFDNLYRMCKDCNDSMLLLEDDVTSYDKDLILSSIGSNPDRVINFNFNRKLGEVKGREFIYLQCVYLPKDVVAMLAEDRHYIYTHNSYLVRTKQHDSWIGNLLNRKGIDFLSIDGGIKTTFKSTLGHDNGTSD